MGKNPDVVGRLELFAKYGPTDEDGLLRGGYFGGDGATDLEIRQMISHESREAMFKLFHKPRGDCEVVVDALLPVAMSQKYSMADVRKILKGVSSDEYGRI